MQHTNRLKDTAHYINRQVSGRAINLQWETKGKSANILLIKTDWLMETFISRAGYIRRFSRSKFQTLTSPTMTYQIRSSQRVISLLSRAVALRGMLLSWEIPMACVWYFPNSRYWQHTYSTPTGFKSGSGSVWESSDSSDDRSIGPELLKATRVAKSLSNISIVTRRRDSDFAHIGREYSSIQWSDVRKMTQNYHKLYSFSNDFNYWNILQRN